MSGYDWQAFVNLIADENERIYFQSAYEFSRFLTSQPAATSKQPDSMLTECPSCLTVFRVTPAILKMGHGQVRCGKCRTQFDAIECMLDEQEADLAPQTPTPSQKPAEKPEESIPDPSAFPDFDTSTYAEEVVMEGSRIEISGRYRMPGANDDANGGDEEVIREHVVIDRSDIDMSSSDEEPAEDSLDTEGDQRDDELQEPSADAATPDAHGVFEAPAVPKRWRRTLLRKKDQAQIHAELSALTKRDRRRVLRTGVWTAISTLLLLTFTAQLIHHNRDALVRDSAVGATISRLYRLFGLSPTPHWDLAAYKWDIYKVGLDPQTPDALRVVGSVANGASFAQPYPLGKLLLQDRWGSPVGEREFEPREYLPSPETGNRLLAPGQRANIEIVIADPGADAVGYAIHACLEQDRRMACADDLPVFKK
jgi:predicted Zn finger-like uncharacterized protein